MKLSERVEQATGDDYSLRMEIAAALGWTKKPVGSVIAWYAPEEPGIMKAGPPKWLTSLDAAMTLVPEGWGVMLHVSENGLHSNVCLARSHPTNLAAYGDTATPAIALCAAALKARGL